MTTRVLIVEDHPIFRDGLVALVNSLPGLTAIGAVGDGAAAVDRAADADVVLMDLNLPGMSGVAATAAITARPDPPAVLVVTMVDDDDTVLAALRAGARGYVLKGASGDEIAAAVVTVATGGAVFGAGVARQLLAASTDPPAHPTHPTDPAHPTHPGAGAGPALTDRERDVLTRLADGASNTQIARALGLSRKTVQNHVSRLLDKLQVADRTQAALLAQRWRDQRGGTSKSANSAIGAKPSDRYRSLDGR